MISITELEKIPFVKTFSVILYLSVTIIPSNLFFYYFEPDRFSQMDFFKLFLLVSGSGLLFGICGFIFSYLTLALIDAQAEEKMKDVDFASFCVFLIFIVMAITIGISCGLIYLDFLETINDLVLFLVFAQGLLYGAILAIVVMFGRRNSRRKIV